MKLIRTVNSRFDPNQPFIQWEGDVRGIIAARRAADNVEQGASYRPRVIQSVSGAQRIARVRADTSVELAA
jgi:hypothetical protein